MTISNIHTTTRVMHMFTDGHSLRAQFRKWLRHQLAVFGLYSLYILWAYEACFTSEGVSSVHNMPFRAHDNPHVMCERAYYVRHNVNIWDGIARDIVMNSSLLLTTLLLSNGVTLSSVLHGAYTSHCEAWVVVSAR